MANWSDTYIYLSSGDKEKIRQAKKTLEKFYEKNEYRVTGLNIEYDELFIEFSDYADELNEIEEKDPIGFKAGFEYMEIFQVNKNENSIEIFGSGRWCSPYLFFEYLAKKYKLDLEYFDAESGCDFSYFLKMKNGKIIKKDDNTYLSLHTIHYLYDNNIWDFVEAHDWYFRDDSELNDDEEEKLEGILFYYGVTKKEIKKEIFY